MGKLSAKRVQTIRQPGRYGDGDGLWLDVKANGRKFWVLRYKRAGRSREMGLGPTTLVSLAEARERAARERKLLRDGRDPLEVREAERAQAAADRAKAVTFRDAALRYIATHEQAWRNAKHRYQWRQSLDHYAFPVFGDIPVGEVNTDLVLRALQPIWAQKAETAARVRQRIESVLDYAAARGLREGTNPARWKGHLDQTLPSPRKVSRTKHHPALPWAEIPSFMEDLRGRDGVAAYALQFTILTAARTVEVIGATWDEIDLTAGVWTIPAERMKAGVTHRVPLSAQAAEIVEAMRVHGTEGVVFPGQRPGSSLSNMAMQKLLRRMGRNDLTVHGFRSTFRDWAAERTSYPNEVIEKSLAHAIGDRVEAAYRRGDLFERRRRLMREWADFCAGQADATGGDVVALGSGTT